MIKIILSLFILIGIPTKLFSQESFWNNFKPLEFSQPIFLLAKNNVKSFDLTITTNHTDHSYSFINDSIIIELTTDKKYVLRDEKVFPILDYLDSVDFYSFWENRTKSLRDSADVKIWEYYETDSTTNVPVLTFRTLIYPDSTVDYSYEIFNYIHTSIKNEYNDSVVTHHKWVDDFDTHRSIETYIRTTKKVNKKSKYYLTTHTMMKIDSDEPIEKKTYELLINKKGKRITEILFSTNVSGVENYIISNIRYK